MLRKTKVPIKIQGIDTKTDDKQSVPGTLSIADNLIYNKIGKIEKALGYSVALNDLNLFIKQNNIEDNINYLDYSRTLLNDKISDYNGEKITLVKSSSNAHADLHNSNGIIDSAQVLTTDINVKSINTKSSALGQQYNEKNQNSVFIQEEGLKVFVSSYDVKKSTGNSKNAISLKIYQDTSFNSSLFSNSFNKKSNLEISNSELELEDATDFQFDIDGYEVKNVKILYFKGDTGKYVIKVFYTLWSHQNQYNKSDIYCYTTDLEKQTNGKWKALNGATAIMYSRNTDMFAFFGSKSTAGFFFEVEKLSETQFCIVYNIAGSPIGTSNFDYYTVQYLIADPSSSMNLEYSYTDILSSKFFQVCDLKKINDNMASAFGWSLDNYYIIFAFTLGNNSLLDRPSKLATAVLQIPKDNSSVASFKSVPAYPTTEYSSIITNIAISSDFFNSIIISHATTTQSPISLSSTNYDIQKVTYLDYFLDLNEVGNDETILNQTLASDILQYNNTQFFVTCSMNIEQPSFYLYSYDFRNLDNISKFKLVSQFFYQNASVLNNFRNLYKFNPEKNVGTSIIYKEKDPTFNVFISAEVLKSQFDGWTTNIQFYKNLFNQDSFNLSEQSLFCSLGYRESFTYDSLVNNTMNYDVVDINLGILNPNINGADLSSYQENCSSKEIIFNINSKTRFKNEDINNTKFLTGGYLSTFDGINLSSNGFHQYPRIIAPDSGTLNQLSSNPIFKRTVSSYDTGDNSLVLTSYSSTDGQGIFKAGDKVRLVMYDPSNILPAIFTVDATGPNPPYMYFSSGSFLPDRISIEYTVTSYDPTTKKLILDGVTLSGTAPTGARLHVWKNPYHIYENTKNYSFTAIYEYKDSNGKISRSAPAIPFLFQANSNYLCYLSLKVTNYFYDNKYSQNSVNRNPVSIKIYRTEGNGSVYYLISSISCDDSSSSIFYNVPQITDEELAKNERLYTTGNVLENIVMPAASALSVKNNRLFFVDAEKRNRVGYSKQIVSGEALEWNDSLYLESDESDGDILNIAALGDKLIIFKENTIYFVTGDGANELGTGITFSQVEKINENIGLDPKDPHVCLTDIGLFFKSVKGIYLLDGGLSPKYIGAGLEAYTELKDINDNLSFRVFNIIASKIKNEVRVITNKGVFNYNLEQNLWTKSNTRLIYDEVSTIQGNFALTEQVKLDHVSFPIERWINTIAKESLTSRQNNYAFNIPSDYVRTVSQTLFNISIRLVTNWLSLVGLENFGRLYRIAVSGQMSGVPGTDKINMSIKYDFNESYSENYTYEESTTLGNNSKYLNFEAHCGTQKCQSFQIAMEEDQNETYADNISLSQFNIEIGAKPKTPYGVGKKASPT